MAIKPKFTTDKVIKYINNQYKKMDKEIIRKLQYIGELCVNDARKNGSYNDDTGNLRNSIGYAVLKDGKIKSKSFNGQTEEGVKAGKKHLSSLDKSYLKGYALIVMAGMNYASYVESTGRNVLTSSEDVAKQLMKELFE